jgi:carbamoylphosphate synthase large subunit
MGFGILLMTSIFRINSKGNSLKQKVIVTGVGGPAGRAATAFFRQRGFHVIGTDIQHVDTIVESFALVPRGDDNSFSRAVLELIVREKPVLMVPTVSEELGAVARIKREIQALGVLVFISEPDMVDCANDKLSTAKRLLEHGIPVPATFSTADAVSMEDVEKHLGYPLIAKPRIGRGGRGVVVYENTADALCEQRTDIVFQEFMPGEECDVNLFAYPAGHVREIAVLQKTAMKQGNIGNALKVQRVSSRDIAELGIRVARSFKLEGPIDIDVRRDRDGLARVLEINARVGANVLTAVEVLESLLTVASEGD